MMVAPYNPSPVSPSVIFPLRKPFCAYREMLNTTEADNKSNLFILRLLIPQNYREKVIGLFFRRYRNLKLQAGFRSFLNIGITLDCHRHKQKKAPPFYRWGSIRC